MRPRRAPALVEVISKPMLRGTLHLVCFFLSLPIAAWIVLTASSSRARVAAAVYAVGLVALFGVSGLYHRGDWGPIGLRRMRRLDHSTIFVMIAGSYTPLCLLVLDGWLAVVMLAAAWSAAILGAVLSCRPGRMSGIAHNALYIVMGWAALLAGPQLVTSLSVRDLVLMGVGGVLFTIGAVSLTTRWPDPFPRVFGYHEVWHVLVVAAVICHLIAISSVVRGAGAA